MNARVSKSAVGNPRVTFSRLGYHAAPNGSFERRLSGLQYPRFHAYLEQSDDSVTISLHLDAKQHTYEGSRAHSGEYDGELVQQEMQRILNAIGQNS